MSIFHRCAFFVLLAALAGPARAATPETQPATLPPAVAPAGHPYARMPKSPQIVLALPADQAYTELLVALAIGDQHHVEQILPKLIAKYPKDQPLLFFYAVCIRSRFEIEDAALLFLAAEALNSKSPEAECAGLMRKIDANDHPDKALADLFKLMNDHQDNLLILWCAAIACRTLNRDSQGCQIYNYIFATFAPAPGPALMHQTCANLLDNLDQHDEALLHRNIVVRMEPAGWSYQGLANTLSALKQFDEADKAYAKATTLDPSSSLFWQTWGGCLLDAGRPADAETKLERALALNPKNFWALFQSGQALESQGDLDQALVKYRKAIEADPQVSAVYQRAANVLAKLGRSDEAAKLLKERPAAAS
jgi:tetratricopeptide (TPR) repeat protein